MENLYTAEEWKQASQKVRTWKHDGHDIVFTNGCFDLLHPGHTALLAYAREQGGKVVIGLNGDASVARLKGEGRPVNSTEVRGGNLLNTGYVDMIVVFDEDTPKELIDMVEPDILIKGSDYCFETTVGAPEVTARGGKVLFFKKIPGLSTSNILSKTQKNIETNCK